LIIFAGIVIRIPSAMSNLLQLIRTDQFSLLPDVSCSRRLAIGGRVLRDHRRARPAPDPDPERAARGRQGPHDPGSMSYFPLRVNTAGVIPAIFASSLLLFPLTIGQFTQHAGDRAVHPGPT
jgi:preprotein translocase subunit SecY